MAAIVAEALQRTAHLRDGQVELRQPDEWPSVLGYAPWVEQVWVNYLSNALKYVGRPGCVDLGATREPDRLCAILGARRRPGNCAGGTG